MKAVILAGGGGTRLWPLSTPERPKQFQPLVSEKTMYEETLARLDFLQPEDIYIATNRDYLHFIQELSPQIPKDNILLEPALRDTASCIGYAAAIIEACHPGEVMAVIYADHLIKNTAAFQEALQKAEQLAQQGTLNIVEVEAKEPNTNYGYVKLGAEIEPNTYQLDCFKEKPDLQTAQKFLEEGNYLWNTGIYVWKAANLLEKYAQHAPETHAKLQEMAANPEKTIELYPTLEKISIDFAIMEKVDPSEVRIIKADLGWSDIGSFEALYEELAQESNLIRGQAKTLDCENSLIYADTKPIKVIGAENLIIVDTEDGLLICQKGRSKDQKNLN